MVRGIYKYTHGALATKTREQQQRQPTKKQKRAASNKNEQANKHRTHRQNAIIFTLIYIVRAFEVQWNDHNNNNEKEKFERWKRVNKVRDIATNYDAIEWRKAKTLLKMWFSTVSTHTQRETCLRALVCCTKSTYDIYGIYGMFTTCLFIWAIKNLFIYWIGLSL